MAACLALRPAFAQQDLISRIEIHGNRRIPAETIRARIFTRPGDVYDQAAIERDFNSLWNTGYFEDIRFEREQTPKGWIVHVYVKERPTIREINYVGLNSVSNSDVLDRFKERKVGLSVRKANTIPPRSRKPKSAEGVAVRARPPIRQCPDGVPADSSGRREHHLRGQRRPEGQSRQNQV